MDVGALAMGYASNARLKSVRSASSLASRTPIAWWLSADLSPSLQRFGGLFKVLTRPARNFYSVFEVGAGLDVFVACLDLI